MKKEIKSSNAPQAIGPYSQAIVSDPFIFLSGQIPLPPEGGKLVEGGIIEKTDQILRNIESVLKEYGATMDHIIKTTIFLTDIKVFNQVNDVYAKYFSQPFPARSTVEVSGLPMNSPIEIEVVAKV